MCKKFLGFNMKCCIHPYPAKSRVSFGGYSHSERESFLRLLMRIYCDLVCLFLSCVFQICYRSLCIYIHVYIQVWACGRKFYRFPTMAISISVCINFSTFAESEKCFKSFNFFHGKQES